MENLFTFSLPALPFASCNPPHCVATEGLIFHWEGKTPVQSEAKAAWAPPRRGHRPYHSCTAAQREVLSSLWPFRYVYRCQEKIKSERTWRAHRINVITFLKATKTQEPEPYCHIYIYKVKHFAPSHSGSEFLSHWYAKIRNTFSEKV